MKLALNTRRFPAAVALATGALLILPASGMASDTFGSRLKNAPANTGECQMLPGPCTLVSFIHPSDPNGDPYAGGAPHAGVITKFRIRALKLNPAQPASVTLRLADIQRQNPDSATARAAGTGTAVAIQGSEGVEEFATRLPVKQGNHLGLDTTNAGVTYNASGSKFTYVFSPRLAEGPGARTSNLPTGELLVQATVEPDADRDGFGDESQDRCPSQASSHGACDRTAPRVAGMRLSKPRLRYRLSEAASVKVRVEKARRGHNGHVRYVKVRGATVKGHKGANRLSFHRKLSAGRYRVKAVATDRNGNRSHAFAKRFRIKR